MSHALFILISILLLQTQSHAAEPSWEISLQEGRYTEAYEIAKRQKTLAQSDFLLGVMALGAQKYEDAKNYFDNALNNEKDMHDYIYLMRGQVNLRMGVAQKALDDFKKSEKLTKNRFLEDLSQFYQAEAYSVLKQWSKAEPLFQKADRKLKRTVHHPQILWGLLVAQVQLKRGSKMCRQAKELFMKYPSYEKIADWGIALNDNSVTGTKLNCAVTFAEQGLRLQRLLWSGLEEKAFEEIQALKKRAPEQHMFDVDSLFVNYLTHVGHIDEAQNILAQYKKDRDGDYEYLMLLGKVYARSTTPDKGIEAYYRAYQLSPKMNQAAPALFQAAFLSYIVSDYKGATAKYEEFNKKFTKHKHYVDSVWYLSWLQYLQKNYEVAEIGFRKILEDKEKSRRKWNDYSKDRIDYWIAMSLMRQGKNEDAVKMFSDLTHDEGIGYYSVAAYQRLKLLSARGLVQAKGVYPIHENWWLPEAVAFAAKKDREEESFTPQMDPAEEKINAILSFEDKAQDVMSEELIVKRIPQYLGEDIKSVYFNNTEKVMKRAYTLARAGLDDLAYREVSDTESKRLTTQQKEWLLKAHKTVNSFNRSVVLASNFFGEQAARLGVHHGNDYWQHSYPRAYDMVVGHYAKDRALPQELIWSIMRAETIFRPDAVSPVGARGLMQVMPMTGRKLASLMGEDTVSIDQLMRPAISIKYGSFYLRRLMGKFRNNVPLVAAAYNGGPHRVHAWMHYFGGLELDEFIEHIPFIETRNYVKKVSKYQAIYNLLYNKKTDVLDILAKPIGFKLEGSIPTKETWER
jgi:soluble lytic murein transglycosylase